MIAPGIVEDMRDVSPVEYIRVLGLRPEDSYGFLPLDLHGGSSIFFLYRDRPEYERARAALSDAQRVREFVALTGAGPSDNAISPDSWLGRRALGPLQPLLRAASETYMRFAPGRLVRTPATGRQHAGIVALPTRRGMRSEDPTKRTCHDQAQR